MSVVKANAYGHGAVRIAQKLQELGTDYFAVAYTDEAVELARCWYYKTYFNSTPTGSYARDLH